MITIIFAGVCAGLIHVLSGPDHLAAIAPLAAGTPRRPWVAGFRWGLGHSAGVLFIGILSLLFRNLISVGLISSFSDRLVGLLLIGMAAWALRKAMQIHSHEHMHDGETHEHIHIHAKNRPHEKHVHSHAAFGIGALHGFAGTSHFLGILPALALPSRSLAIAYLLAFGAGTVLAMTGFSSIFGTFANHFQFRLWKVYRGLMFTCSLFAFGIGTMWITGHSW